MSKYINHPEKEVFYFITITCYKWLNLIEKTNVYSDVYKWFNILIKQFCYIVGYVIMPNHIHFILYQKQQSQLLNRLVANGKRFLAYRIIHKLEEIKDYKTLKFLSCNVTPRERKIGKKHQVFQPSFDAKLCFSNEMLEQKINYIHENPVNKGWHLADTYLDYKYSSARFYEYGEEPDYPNLIHYLDIPESSESSARDSEEG